VLNNSVGLVVEAFATTTSFGFFFTGPSVCVPHADGNKVLGNRISTSRVESALFGILLNADDDGLSAYVPAVADSNVIKGNNIQGYGDALCGCAVIDFGDTNSILFPNKITLLPPPGAAPAPGAAQAPFARPNIRPLPLPGAWQ
jgi:hypothetical protein